MRTTDFASDFAFSRLVPTLTDLGVADYDHDKMICWFWESSKSWFANSQAEFDAHARVQLNTEFLTRCARRGSRRTQKFSQSRRDAVQQAWVTMLEKDTLTPHGAYSAGMSGGKATRYREFQFPVDANGKQIDIPATDDGTWFQQCLRADRVRLLQELPLDDFAFIVEHLLKKPHCRTRADSRRAAVILKRLRREAGRRGIAEKKSDFAD
jgi:hypothetical protein